MTWSSSCCLRGMATRSCWNGRTRPVWTVRSAACWSTAGRHMPTQVSLNRLRELESRHIDRSGPDPHRRGPHRGNDSCGQRHGPWLEIGEVWYNGSPHLVDKLGARTRGDPRCVDKPNEGSVGTPTFDRKAAKATDVGQSLTSVLLPGDLTVTVLGPAQSDLPSSSRLLVTSRSRRPASRWARPRRPWTCCSESEPCLKPKSGIPRRDRSLTSNDSPETAEAPTRRPEPQQHRPARRVQQTDRVLTRRRLDPRGAAAAIERLLDERGIEQLELTDFKVPHHGSAKNITREILALAPAERYLFSTDGGYFSHPDDDGRCDRDSPWTVRRRIGLQLRQPSHSSVGFGCAA